MRLKLSGITGESILSVLFLMLVFSLAGVTLKRTLQTINEIPVGGHTFKISFANTKQKINTAYSDMINFKGRFLVNKGTYIEIHGLMARLMGQRIMNGIVKLKNGHLSTVQSRFDTSPYISGLKQLKELCENQGISFLYIQAPVKIHKYNKQLPVGVSDYYNENMDEFLLLARNAGVEILDLRDELHNDGLDHYNAFFKTDHHWTPETGFWAANKIKSLFVKKGMFTNVDTTVSDLSNYHSDIYDNIFMGSSSQRTGVIFGGIDGINLMYPRFETDIKKDINDLKTQGSFKEIMFDMSPVQI